MPDYLDLLARDAKETISEGYYKIQNQDLISSISLSKAIIERKNNAIITEVKAASPSKGIIKSSFDPTEVASAMKKGGAIGISVLIEPKHFNGSLEYLKKVREAVSLPILFKDIIISSIQIETASRMGANAILLIEALFQRKYCENNIDEMIKLAHARNLEVLLEIHNEIEFQNAVETEADLVGINNRDLRTLRVDLYNTERILKKCEIKDKIVISESGILTTKDLIFLQRCGAQAFLIGSSVMMAKNIESKVKEFVNVH
ncbi:MAG: indole-3-glycerol-phosphate synthase [Candidatus Bathyarchaeota archaeon]